MKCTHGKIVLSKINLFYIRKCICACAKIHLNSPRTIHLWKSLFVSSNIKLKLFWYTSINCLRSGLNVRSKTGSKHDTSTSLQKYSYCLVGLIYALARQMLLFNRLPIWIICHSHFASASTSTNRSLNFAIKMCPKCNIQGYPFTI